MAARESQLQNRVETVDEEGHLDLRNLELGDENLTELVLQLKEIKTITSIDLGPIILALRV